MRILVAGGTGVIGRQLVPRLVKSGHEVFGIARQGSSQQSLIAMGAHALLADVFDRTALANAFSKARPETVIHQLTALPRRIDPRHLVRDLGPTNRLRTEGTNNLLEAAHAAGAHRFITQSIAFFGTPDEGLASEDEPLFLDAPAGAFRAIIEAVATMEKRVAESPSGGKPWVSISLRYGQFYGPGTIFDDDGSFTEDMRRRRVPIVGDGQGRFSFVHVVDAAKATERALETKQSGIYHIVDDRSATVAEVLPELASVLGAKPPWRVPAWVARPFAGAYGVFFMTRMRGASNARAKEHLGWTPTIPDWRDGMRQWRTTAPSV